MPSVVTASISTPWKDGTGLVATVATPWKDGTVISTLGSPFVPPDPPGGSTPTEPTLTPDFVLNVADLESVVHTIVCTDLRDDTAIEFYRLGISTDDASVCWTLTASGPASLFARFTADGDLPIISVVLDGIEWRFLIEDIRQSRTFGATTVSVTGRSQTITAGDPYEFASNWINDGPATAAQLVVQAQAFTLLDVDWAIDDWLVPDKVWSFTGTPLAVAKRVAESVSAIVASDRKDFRISILPRYRALPNEWPHVPPDVEVHIAAAQSLSYERADQPAYNGVYVSGQQQGAVAHVYLAGTSGDKLAPLVTDLLLTDLAANEQRGVAILGAAGQQAKVQMLLPVLVGAGQPGVLNLGMLCHVVDDGDGWWGMVRAVSVAVEDPSITQMVTLERHTRPIPGTVITE